MNYHVCRACLKPESDIQFTSIFSEDGKLSHLIFELTNLKVNIAQTQMSFNFFVNLLADVRELMCMTGLHVLCELEDFWKAFVCVVS